MFHRYNSDNKANYTQEFQEPFILKSSQLNSLQPYLQSEILMSHCHLIDITQNRRHIELNMNENEGVMDRLYKGLRSPHFYTS